MLESRSVGQIVVELLLQANERFVVVAFLYHVMHVLFFGGSSCS